MNSKQFLIVAAAVFLIAVGAGCGGGDKLTRSYDQDSLTVAVIDGMPLSLSEFETQYAKTVGGRAEAMADSVGEYQDFLERWVDFRLKVMAARDAGLDKDSALVSELDSYRDQFARPFLMDREVTDPLIRDLYSKRQKMVDASHILIRVDKSASPDDTLKAYQKLSAIRDSILAGSDFGDMAVRYSQDPSASSAAKGPGYRGRLGFIRGGRLVPEFEDVAFSIPLGVVSPVFRTQFGYHILKVHDRKPAVPDVRISHIMVTPKSPEDSVAAWEKVRAIGDSLEAGVDFADLARRNSDDGGSARAGGDIGFVAIDGRLVPAIKDAAFALGDIGDYAGPIETQFGIHYVKLTDRRQVQSLDDAYEDLRRQVARSPQLDERRSEFAHRLLEDYGFTVDTLAIRNLFGNVSADSASAMLSSGKLRAHSPSTGVATIGPLVLSQADFVDWAGENPVNSYSDFNDLLNTLVDRFLVAKVIDYKLSNLEAENEEFRQTMRDFVDGLLLFRLMDDSVWTRAAADTVELRRRYDANPERFVYPDRFRLVSVYARTKAIADSVAALLDSGRSVEQLMEVFPDTSSNRIRVDTTFVEGATNSVFDKALTLSEGEHTRPLTYNRGFTVIVHGGVEASRTKTFEEAKTEIVSQYQEDLENSLVKRLRERYGAITYPWKVLAAFRGVPSEGLDTVSVAN